MDVGQRRAQLAQDVGVELEVDVRVLAVDAVDLGELRVRVLRDGVLDELVGGERVRLAPACCVFANAQNLHFTRQTFVWFK